MNSVYTTRGETRIWYKYRAVNLKIDASLKIEVNNNFIKFNYFNVKILNWSHLMEILFT